MAIQRDNGFLVNTDIEGNLSIGIESSCLDECIAEVGRRGAVGVFGSPDFGFYESDLDFLGRLRDLKKVWFWDVVLRDVDGVYLLNSLRQFGIHPKRPAVDFGRLPNLEEIVWHYSPKDSSISSLKLLRLLHVWHFNPKHHTFDGLDLSSGLTELQINWANPRTLDGLPRLPALKRLELHHCRNLETLSALPNIAPNVEHLVVAACSRVSDGPEVVRQLPMLRHAFVRDELLVSS